MEDYRDIKLDVGCGQYKADGYIGIDKRDIDGVDIVHDICKFPWPLPDNCCTHIRMILVWACIEPKHRLQVMDELWRVAAKDCVLDIRETHTLSPRMMHDPAYYTGANEITFCYFDPRHEKYRVYQPKPWHVLRYESNYTSVVAVQMEPMK